MTISALVSATAWGADTCPRSYTGTTSYPSQNAFPPGVSSVHCANCREVIGFTQDAINYLWNRATHGQGGYQVGADPVTNQFDYMINQTSAPSVYMTTPVCNDHGQCISVTLTVNFYYETYTLGPLTLTRNTSIKNIKARATRRNGTVLSRTYTPEQIDAASFPVPYNNTNDPHPKEECLDNLGELSNLTNTPISDDIPGSQGPEDYEQWERWHDEEEAYGGRIPHRECGIASLPGGTSTRTCQWIYLY